MSRIVEVFTGAYASGKSEISINRALMLSKLQEKLTLVDLDTVEPAYTLRPLKKELDKLGITVITQEDYFGLGEAGNVVTNAQINCLNNKGNIVIDVGYGVGGLDILELIQGIEQEEDLKIYIVINTSKPETATVDDIVSYINWSSGDGTHKWKKLSGIISNTHFGDQTEKADIVRGLETTKKAAEKLNLPVIALGVPEELYPEFESDTYENVPIWVLKRYMPKALW